MLIQTYNKTYWDSFRFRQKLISIEVCGEERELTRLIQTDNLRRMLSRYITVKKTWMMR